MIPHPKKSQYVGQKYFQWKQINCLPLAKGWLNVIFLGLYSKFRRLGLIERNEIGFDIFCGCSGIDYKKLVRPVEITFSCFLQHPGPPSLDDSKKIDDPLFYNLVFLRSSNKIVDNNLYVPPLDDPKKNPYYKILLCLTILLVFYKVLCSTLVNVYLDSTLKYSHKHIFI